MKRIISVFLIFMMLGTLLTACATSKPVDGNSSDNTKNEKISVVSTIFPQYDFVRQIAGDNVELTMLLPPGSESHSFEPTPQDIIRIQNCDMFIYVGGESDAWIDEILASMDTSKMQVVSLMDLVDTVEEEIVEGMEDDHGHDHEEGDTHGEEHADEYGNEDSHEKEYDEHVWTSPKNAMKIVQALSDKLRALDSKNASLYQQNTTAYLEKLDNLDQSFREAVAAGSRKTLVFGDRFPFRYFADTYGLEYFAAFPGCSTETEASAATVAFLIDKVKRENIPVVFHIELSNEKMADTICEATGAKKLLLHSSHNITKADFEKGISYLDLMTQNVENLKEALK